MTRRYPATSPSESSFPRTRESSALYDVQKLDSRLRGNDVVAGVLRHYERIADAPDAVARLRGFVLDLAVKGKLVPQLAVDEPASALLLRIAAEKARRVQSGEARPPKALPPPEDPPCVLPDTWQWSCIAEIGFISPRVDADDDVLASFVPMPLIAAEVGVEHQHEQRKWGEIKKGYTHFAEGDVGLAKITPCFENGKSTVFRNLTGGIGSGTTELHVVRPVLVPPDYVLLFFKSSHFIQTGIPRMTGTAGQKRVPADYFAYSPFPLPPLAEQHRIVAKVDELMALCDRLEAVRTQRETTRDRLTASTLARLNAPEPAASPDGEAPKESSFQSDASFALNVLPALTSRTDQIKQLRQTILNLAVRGKLVPQETADGGAAATLSVVASEISSSRRGPLFPGDEPYQVPANWHWIRFGSLIAHSDAGWSPKTENHPRTGSQWGVLKVSAVSWGQFRPDENKQVLPSTEPRDQAVVRKGDFLLSRANTAELVARAVIVYDDPINLMLSDKIVRLRLTQHCDRNFLLIVNNHADFARQHYAIRASGVSPSMKNISRDVIYELPIPFPPLSEQRRIVAKVDELMSLCDQLEASLTRGENTRSRLLNALLHEALAPADTAREAA